MHTHYAVVHNNNHTHAHNLKVASTTAYAHAHPISTGCRHLRCPMKVQRHNVHCAQALPLFATILAPSSPSVRYRPRSFQVLFFCCAPQLPDPVTPKLLGRSRSFHGGGGPASFLSGSLSALQFAENSAEHVLRMKPLVLVLVGRCLRGADPHCQRA